VLLGNHQDIPTARDTLRNHLADCDDRIGHTMLTEIVKPGRKQIGVYDCRLKASITNIDRGIERQLRAGFIAREPRIHCGAAALE
jgi:hypothetical protein